MLKLSAKQKARRDRFQPRDVFISDPQVGLCKPHPWRVQASDGFQVLQIVTEPGMSKLEKRSLYENSTE